MTQRQPRQHDEKHLAFIRQLPCLRCGNDIQTEAAHVRYGEPEAGKRSSGLGEKPDDCWTIPLCGRCHREQHLTNERQFWIGQNVNPVKVAAYLALACPNVERGMAIVAANRADRG